MSARSLRQRLKALEAHCGRQAVRCVLWWPGQRFADAVAVAPGLRPIAPTDRVHLIKFVAAGAEDDETQRVDQPVADAWLAARAQRAGVRT